MADNSPPGESISEAFPGGFAVVRLRTQTLIILHLQPDDPDHKSGCSADDPASDRFVKEEYAPENGEYGHHALDHGNHIKGHQGDGFGIEVKAHSRDKAEGKDGKDAGQIRTDKSYFPCKYRLCGRDQGKRPDRVNIARLLSIISSRPATISGKAHGSLHRYRTG